MENFSQYRLCWMLLQHVQTFGNRFYHFALKIVQPPYMCQNKINRQPYLVIVMWTLEAKPYWVTSMSTIFLKVHDNKMYVIEIYNSIIIIYLQWLKALLSILGDNHYHGIILLLSYNHRIHYIILYIVYILPNIT